MNPQTPGARRASVLHIAAAFLVAFGVSAPAAAQIAPNPDGTVRLDGVTVPLSDLLSEEAKTYLRHLIVDKPFAGGPGMSDIKGERAHQDWIMQTFLAPMRARYAVKVEEQRIGGVVVDVVTPLSGIKPNNRRRVLLNVHGGGFSTGARTASLVESIPIAATMGVKVISIDYRMGPEYKFPAATEDVVAVYREILKQYAPSRIGLYGCSAGGMLTGQSIAWFETHGLPNPGAAGIFCASLGRMFAGDAAHLVGPLNGMTPPAPGQRRGPADAALPPPGYLAGVATDNPLAFPINAPELLAKFPPTLFITGSRAMEFSAALDSNNKLAKAGVETRLHAWDAMFHGFFYNSEMPESREAYDVIARFFDTHLKR